MIDEIEFDELERNEFLYKMNMIDNTVKIIQSKRTIDYQKKQAAIAKMKARSKGR